MTVAFQRMFGVMERWNNNYVTPSLIKPLELSYRSNSLLFSLPFPKVLECYFHYKMSYMGEKKN